ncbi:LCP family protein [Acrocarpospora sp. B8E8]|uniref:LCP family protein n=1 Tax=Acrocarpospora sp. B8E8 TaxID=3153572 RepID=UPI00325FAABF
MKKPAGVIGWLALSAVLPGAAHLRAGWTRTGLALLGTYLGIVLTGFAIVKTADAGLAGRALRWLTEISMLAWAAALGWFVLIVHSFIVLRPWRLPRKGQILTGTVAGVLAIVMAAPFVITAQYVTVSQRALERMFGGSAEPIGDPWSGRDRVNVLLVGGDADENRIGMRTDSVNVASVDVRTGDTVVFSLPRNLEDVRFPPGSPMHARFPDGFRLPVGAGGSREDLLFSVWEYADEHPELFGGRQGMGAQTLKETVGYTLGLKIDWYAMVNIWGFARIVDALGGLVLTVDRDVVFGRYNEGLVRAGTRRLGGAEALWFARSRTFSDDFTRMRRQRCVFNALLTQADPASVLARFNQIAAATQDMIQTDVPRGMLEHLVPLAAKVKHAKVTSVQFVPPLIHTGYPDWDLIRRVTAQALEDQARPKSVRTRPANPVEAVATPTAAPPTVVPPTAVPPAVVPSPDQLKAGCDGM